MTDQNDPNAIMNRLLRDKARGHTVPLAPPPSAEHQALNAGIREAYARSKGVSGGSGDLADLLTPRTPPTR
jgi:hypothetical protein